MHACLAWSVSLHMQSVLRSVTYVWLCILVVGGAIGSTNKRQNMRRHVWRVCVRVRQRAFAWVSACVGLRAWRARVRALGHGVWNAHVVRSRMSVQALGVCLPSFLSVSVSVCRSVRWLVCPLVGLCLGLSLCLHPLGLSVCLSLDIGRAQVKTTRAFGESLFAQRG